MNERSRLDVLIPAYVHQALRIQSAIERVTLGELAARVLTEHVNTRNAQSRTPVRVVTPGEPLDTIRRDPTAEQTASSVREAYRAPRPVPKPGKKSRG